MMEVGALEMVKAVVSSLLHALDPWNGGWGWKWAFVFSAVLSRDCTL